MNLIDIGSLPYVIGCVLFSLLGIKLVGQTVLVATRRANYLLACLCIVFAMIEADAFVSANHINFTFYPILEKLQNAAHLLLGPLTYLYLVSMSAQPKLGRASLAHFALFLSGIILMWLPLSERAMWLGFIVLYLASLLPYTFFCLRRIQGFDLKAKQALSDLKKHNLIGIKIWVYLMAFICLYVLVSPLYQWFFERSTGPIDIQYLLAVFAAYLLIRQDFTYQSALSDLPTLVKDDVLINDSNLKKTTQESQDKSVYLGIEKQFIGTQVYLNNRLTLTDLSELTGYSNNQISAALNQVAGKCFYDYVNEYRIEEAKRIMLDSPSKAIVDIAIAAGFNSKSAFYTAFSKQGIGTPSEFRRQQLAYLSNKKPNKKSNKESEKNSNEKVSTHN